ncbi:hypothetical protein FISHEDRAFT_65062 [Fistulina hepatica ATCC 64428]|uniref:DDE-1 domain-containing protein n=1 Tax=Fistulina hepatica ATCC 64428 TaxID=1128425 RepID=A0A0D7AF01_9AGAR|nr:hypothetical protein FISHEDRAFT_65062 [Fistulina hepatica ATCC 64428]
MGWSERASTRASQKMPANYRDILEEAFYREAWVIRDHDVPAELRVNTDQTNMVLVPGTRYTWAQKGAKQVPMVGIDDKRAFTLVPSISVSGELLPFQAIYQGLTNQSLPSAKCPTWSRAEEMRFRLLPSKTSTYWSTMDTMKDLVNTIIAPYFDHKRVQLERQSDQKSIWKIDCWSVHKSKEFLAWMRQTHPCIVVIFVPANCTGLTRREMAHCGWI